MRAYYADDAVTLHHGKALDVLPTLDAGSVACCVTSPPYYGLRDYGVDGQLGAEPSPAEYVAALVATLAEVRRVLADDGTLWLNLGDSYAAGGSVRTLGRNDAGRDLGGGGNLLGSGNPGQQGTRPTWGEPPAKNMLGIPWRVAFALQDDGWILRNDNIWAKPNAMPESVRDRLSSKHEYVFLLTKGPRYWFDLDPIREPLAYPEAADGTRVFRSANRDDKLAGEPRKGGTYGRPGATPPGNTPQTNFGPTGSRNGRSNPDGRNPGDVWTIPTSPFPGAHFATFPVALAERCILAGCKLGGTVLDPFSGSGTTGLAAARRGHSYVGIDLNREYLELSLSTRLRQTALVDGDAS